MGFVKSSFAVILASFLSTSGIAEVAERIDVTLVEIPVVVVDRAGKPVRGLTAENFRLKDDGKTVAIEHFEVLDLSRLAEDEPLHPAARRNFLLIFDLSNSTPGNIGRAREAARQFVEVEMSHRDLAAVATFTVEQGVRMLTAFSGDRGLLIDAITTMGHPRYFTVGDPLFISAVMSTPVSSDAGDSSGSGFDSAYTELVESARRSEQQATQEYRRVRLAAQLGHFGEIAKVLDRLSGQKQVILFSEGFDARIVHGREDVAGLDSRAEAEAGFSGEVWKIDSDQRYGSSTSMRELNEMAEIFRRTDVLLHTVDIRGLRSEVDSREGLQRSSNEALFLLSNPTGGKVFKNANDLGSSLRGMLEQQEVVYLLGFRAKPTGRPGRFHELDVRTEGIRGARVSHRAGYHEPSGSLSPLEQALSAASILINDIPIEQVALSMAASPFPGSGKHPVSVLLEIPGPRLLEGLRGSRASGEIFIYAFDDRGKVVDYIHQALTFDLDQVGQTIAEGGIRYYGKLMLDPGEYAIKALVRVAETDRAGFRKLRLHVPRFDEPTAVAPVLISDADDAWLMLRAPDRPGTAGDYPFAVGEQSFVPEIEPTLLEDSERRLVLFTYHLPPEGMQFRIAVEGESGGAHPAKVALVGRTPAEADGTIRYVFDFFPGGLPAGRYRLQFTMLPADLNPVEASMPFIIGAAR